MLKLCEACARGLQAANLIFGYLQSEVGKSPNATRWILPRYLQSEVEKENVGGVIHRGFTVGSCFMHASLHPVMFRSDGSKNGMSRSF